MKFVKQIELIKILIKIRRLTFHILSKNKNKDQNGTNMDYSDQTMKYSQDSCSQSFIQSDSQLGSQLRVSQKEVIRNLWERN